MYNRLILISKRYRLILQPFMFVGVFLLAGCETPPPLPPATSTPAPATVAAISSTTTPAARETTATPTTTTQPMAGGIASTEAPLSLADNRFPPVFLSIPEIELDVAISPMGWRVAETDGVRTTVWVLPETGAGWHSNSATAGANGNVVISGHQLLGDAAFASLALGDVAVGQVILLTDAQGSIFTYEVVEVSEPLPVPDSLEAEEALAAEITASTGTPILTLISGWPDFSSTHRVIVTAELVTSGG